MGAGVLGYVVVALAVRQLSLDLSAARILAIRAAGGLLIALLLAARVKDILADLRSITWKDHLLRSALHAAASLALVWSVSNIPVALVATIDFTGPLFAVAIGIGLAGIWPHRRTWAGLALIAAGAAALILLHRQSIGPGLLVPFAAVAVVTRTNMMLGDLSRKHLTVTILLVMNAAQLVIYLALIALEPALPSFGSDRSRATVAPAGPVAFAVAALAIAASGYVTQMSISNATRYGTAVQVSALDTLRIPALAAAGALLLSEPVDNALLLSGSFVMAGAILVAILDRERTPPSQPDDAIEPDGGAAR